MTHTLETLLPLLGPDGKPVSSEAEDQLRICTAEADGWRRMPDCNGVVYPDGDWRLRSVKYETALAHSCPAYPTSLDAIYAAEERLGLHEIANVWLVRKWGEVTMDLLMTLRGEHILGSDFAFMTPAQRCLPFIITAQWKKQNETQITTPETQLLIHHNL